MDEHDLDAVYTHLCKTMTRIGEAEAPLFLARFALLAIDRIGNASVSQQLIDEASKGIPEAGGAQRRDLSAGIG